MSNQPCQRICKCEYEAHFNTQNKKNVNQQLQRHKINSPVIDDQNHKH